MQTVLNKRLIDGIYLVNVILPLTINVYIIIHIPFETKNVLPYKLIIISLMNIYKTFTDQYAFFILLLFLMLLIMCVIR